MKIPSLAEDAVAHDKKSLASFLGGSFLRELKCYQRSAVQLKDCNHRKKTNVISRITCPSFSLADYKSQTDDYEFLCELCAIR